MFKPLQQIPPVFRVFLQPVFGSQESIEQSLLSSQFFLNIWLHPLIVLMHSLNIKPSQAFSVQAGESDIIEKIPDLSSGVS